MGLAFWRAGFETVLWAPLGGRPRPPRNARVWVIDTESRHLPPAAAARRVRSAVGALKAWGATFFYKKIDSTLRGPVGAELKAFLKATGPGAPVPVVPAHPLLGRITRGGVHYVNGVPLRASAAGRDPRAPVASSRVARLLGQALDPKLFFIPDVSSLSELNALARAGVRAGGSRAVGASALAGALARLWGRPRRNRKGPSLPRWVVVSGSAHPASRAQYDYLSKRLPRRAGPGDPALFTAPRSRGRPDRVAAQLRERVRRHMGAGSSARLRGTGWWVAGGETAFGLVRLWKAPVWRVAGTVDEGVALCRTEGPDPRWLVTKPGGFGRPDLIWRTLGR